MARGFITGALSGTVMAAGIGAVASVVAPGPQQSAGRFDAGVVMAVAMPAVATQSDAPQMPRVQDAPPASPTTVLGATPDADTLESVARVAEPRSTAPEIASTPADGLVQSLDIAATAQLAGTGAIATGSDDPVTRAFQSLALVLPPPADRVQVKTAPIALAQIAPEPPIAVQEVAVIIPAPDVVEVPALVPSTPPAIEALQPALFDPAPAESARVTVISQEEPIVLGRTPVDPPEAPALKRKPVVPDELAVVNRPVVVAAEPEAEAREIVVAQATPAPAETPRIQIGKPAVSLTDRKKGVVVNRIGTAATVQTPAAQPADAAPKAKAAVVETDPRPVAQHRQAFENTDGKPLMSIVLIDNGSTAIEAGTDIADLRDFPYPLSFAVDSTLPDAQERISMYRAEGFEVLGMIDLPPGALASDVETTFSVLLPQMGEIVGVLEGPGAGLQETREVSDQVTLILAESGHGLVAQAKGLNTMPNLARKAGVAAAPVFRDFDNKGQNERVIRRFLDQAAFKAGQEGAVIMLGRLRAETISALLVWGLQDRAGQVALAPVSAVLLRDDQ